MVFDLKRKVKREKDLSAIQSKAAQQTRLSCPHRNGRREKGLETAAAKGPKAFDTGLIFQ